MDSGNSCSMQSSSSGGDEEIDNSSRGETISSFFNLSPNFGSISTPHDQNPTFLDPQNIDYNNNNNDLIWCSKGLKSQQNYSNFNNLTASSSSSLPSSGQEGPFPNSSPSLPLHTSKPLPSSDHLPGVIKKSTKKRTRASRRAPTTVLTTDTTNFRQMVQEFTGIPAAPLSGTSLYSRRLDLFSAAAALRSGAHLDTLGPLYPLRPSAHKGLSPFSSSPPPPSLLNSTMIDSTVPTTTTLGGSGSNNSNNYPQSSNHLLSLQNRSIPLHLGGNVPMNFSDLSGFPNQENPSAGAGNDHMRRWKSGETVKNNDGVEENLLVSTFHGNINSGESQHMSGYNLNISEKGMENAVSTGDGNVASWICSSD